MIKARLTRRRRRYGMSGAMTIRGRPSTSAARIVSADFTRMSQFASGVR